MSVPDILPPSPPTTSSRKQRLPFFPIPPTSTPDDSPASQPPSSLGSRKKVGFSPWTDIHESTEVVNPTDKIPVRPLLPSRDCSTSNKSILKANDQGLAVPSSHDGPGDEKQSLNEIMESILHQLARNDSTECVDAYQTLAAAVKAYDELPEQLVLRNKLQSITKSIKLHLSALDQPEPQPCDINLVTSALKVLVILVWNSDFAPYLSDDFRLYVLDRAISTVVEHKAPKSVLVHYLHLLAMQDFRQGILTSSRASRLIDGLAVLSEHVKGNGVVSERLLVYGRLLDQAKPVMKLRAGFWIEHVLSAMTSAIQDTRTKARELGMKVFRAFPASDSIAIPVRAVLDDVQNDNNKKGYAMCKKLEKMIATKETAEHVPQIWAVVILLCYSESRPIDSWSGLKEWLMVIQRCFNSSDSNLRLQANLAWHRFVYAARPHAATDGLMAMLSKPIVAQLERHSSDKHTKSAHAAAVSSYCNLLYYAFRPATSPARLTKAWNEYIVKVMRSSFFEKHPANADIACRILMALLWNVKAGTKVWNEKRAHENRSIEPDELPTIDNKWIRGHAGNIVDIFELLFRYSSWGFAESSEQAYVSRAWRHLVKSVRSGSNKEIKMSNETRISVLAILRFIDSLASIEDHESGLPSNVLANITTTAIAELGTSHVLEALDTDRIEATPWILGAVYDQLRQKLQTSSSPSKQHTEAFAKLVDLLGKRLVGAYNTEQVNQAEVEDLVALTSRTISTPAEPEIVLAKLQAGLSFWLKDQRNLLSSSCLGRLAEAFARAMSKVRQESIRDLDVLFASAFASVHATVVSFAATAWNSTFGECEDMHLGPLLLEAFQRLQPHLELKLSPEVLADLGDEVHSTLAYNTQNVGEAHPTSVEQESRFPDDSDLDVDVAASADQDGDTRDAVQDVQEVEDEVSDVGKTSTSTRRRRHNDSQTEFVTVDSSPVAADSESQFLTDRQKEVRDRQRSEPAVVFPDLRSSPRPVSRASSESRGCGFARKAATMVERPSTPVPDAADEAEAQPSPTPKSRYVRNVADVDIPSSPPSLHGAPDKLPGVHSAALQALPPTASAGAGEDDVTIDEEQPLEQEHLPESSDEAKVEESNIEQEEPIVDADELAQDFAQDSTADAEQSLTADKQVIEAEGEGSSAGQTLPRALPADSVVETVFRQNNTQDEPSHKVSAAPGAAEWAGTPSEEHVIGSEASHLSHAPSTPIRASSKIGSDELEQLSASQLSHDLDWSVVLDGLDQTPASVVPIEQPAVEVPSLPAKSQAAPTRVSGRKRKAAGALWSRNKKTKKSTRVAQQSTESQEPIVKREDEEELYDVIEVVTSSDPPAPSSPPGDVEPEVFVDAPESQVTTPKQKKKRGRPRKNEKAARSVLGLERGSSISSGSQRSRRSIYSHEPSTEPQVIEPPTEDINMDEAEMTIAHSTALQEEVSTVDETVEQDEALVAQQTRDSVSERKEMAPTMVDQQVQTPIDVISSLEHILQQVKTAQPGTVDLRAVDELCFQIRYQAQVKSMQ
ncbi:uncharacterized protein HMPREF1541_06889 [Cyphellophora europaea CBS 101466]|uniref:Telomere-associated protein Rif1 N-terminal domain-containing protein n=1 Tax=Cyphellophora europaea (strain CBS 101466) TaxID=1220924 RepID=W2RSY2_CYPE1|nr:uncharacterized protein HMPREF1541_06889 [Cyphellophora europaea CBS 101466]ETN38848.1 hypothetical protein HMPREF1541_06889 [Cyphellophora europaea CBS 101466]